MKRARYWRVNIVKSCDCFFGVFKNEDIPNISISETFVFLINTPKISNEFGELNHHYIVGHIQASKRKSIASTFKANIVLSFSIIYVTDKFYSCFTKDELCHIYKLKWKVYTLLGKWFTLIFVRFDYITLYEEKTSMPRGRSKILLNALHSINSFQSEEEKGSSDVLF
jgi:hypothetical protein